MIFLHHFLNLKASVPIHWIRLEKSDWHIFLNIFVCVHVCVSLQNLVINNVRIVFFLVSNLKMVDM